jgi:replicative DNA helicase
MVGPVKRAPDPTLERRAPPHSVEAEMAVLGGVLLHNEALDQVRDLLEVDDFYQPAHQRLFRACCILYDRGDPIDPITLRNELKLLGLLDEIGGAAYLERLLDEVHTTANIEQYARIVAEKALLRRMLGATHEIQGMIIDGRADDGTPLETDQIVDRSQQIVFDVARETVRSPYESLEQVINESMDYLSARMKSADALAGYTTGFPDLDDKTNGVKGGELIIVAARPGMGKTSLALNIGMNLTLHEKLPVLMFSLEMNAVQIGLRILCSQSGVPIARVMKGQLGEPDMKQLTDAASRILEAAFYLDDSGAVNINTIRAKARRLRAEKGSLGLVIVDYIQMIRSARSYDSREREIADLSRHLKLLAKELECPVMALSQLNRQLESREDKRPRPSDLRESGSLEQDADLILFLYRDSVYNDAAEEPNKTELIIGKQRSGPTGTVPLSFRDEITRFDSYESHGGY